MNESKEKFNRGGTPNLTQSDDAKFFLASIVESLEDSVVSVDFNTIITSWNRGAERLYGYSAAEVIGKPLTMLTLPEDLERILANIESIKRGETVQVYETESIHKEGHRIHLSITLSPVKNDRGEIIGVSTLARDITDRMRTEDALRVAHQHISDILESTTDCFFALDHARRFTYVNSQTEAYFGIPKEQLLGRVLTEVLPQLTGHEITKRQDEAISARRPVHFEALSPVTGKWLELHFYPTNTGLAVYFRDVTDRKKADEALRKSEEQLRLAISISQISTFDIDLLTDEVKTDEIGRGIYGWTAADEPLTFTRVQSHFHPDDREYVMQAVAAALEPDGAGAFQVEQRIIRTDGATRWIRVHGRAIFEGEGASRRAVRCLGTYIDITEQKQAEEAARAGYELYEIVAQTTNDAIWDWNLLTNHLAWNKGVRALFGYAPEQISDSIEWWYEHLHPEDRDRVVESIHRVIDSASGQEWSDEYRFMNADGSFAEVLDRGYVIRDGEGKAVRMLGGMTDITQRKRSEAILQRYRLLSESARDIVWMLRPDGKIIEVNQAAVDAYGYSREELLQMNIRDLRAPSTHSRLAEDLKKAHEGVHFETVHLRKDGTTFPVEVSANAAEIGGERLVMSIVRDITERRRAEDALARLTAQSEQQRRLYETILSTTPDLVYVFGRDHRFTYANKALLAMWGRTWEEAIGKTFLELGYEPWHAEMHDREIEQVIASGQPIRGEVPFNGTNGRRIYDYIFVPVFGANGEVEAIAGTTRDVTESKHAEEILRRTQARLESVLEAGLAGTFFWDIRQDLVVTDENMMRYFSLSEKSLTEGVPLAEVLPAIYEEDRARVTDALTEAIERSGVYQIEYRVRNSDGRVIWLSARGVVERDAAGNPVELTGFAVDITRIKEAEEALRESEEQLRTLANTIPQLAWMAEPDGFISWYNRRWYDYTGTTPEQMEGWGWQTVHDEELLPQVVERWKYSIETGEPFEMEFPLRRADGEFRWFLTRINPLRDSQGSITRWFGTNTDIHENRIAQRNVEFLASVSDDLAQLRTAAEVMQVVGAKIGEYLNLSLCAFVEIGEAEDKAVVTHNWHRSDVPSIAGAYNLREYLSEEFQRAARAGEVFVVHDVFSDLRTKGEMYDALKVGSFVCVPLVRDGRWRFLLNIHDSQPRIWREDEIELTRELAARIWTRLERARAEEERDRLLESEQTAREEAERANRLKDEFLATISHELRTPLNAILGWSQILLSNNFGEPETIKRATETIERNARAQSQLIEDLLDISRIITGKLRLDVRAVDLPGVIMAAVDAARPAAEAKNIRLQTLLDPEAATISGDPDRLQQVIWNLLSNAIKFTPKDGQVQVRLERVDSHIEIVVTDTGVGIAPEFLPFVFERFRQSDGSTTRRHGGLGLGLAIVRQLVELHGGTVSVTSAGEGKGAAFTVSLPLLAVLREPVSGDESLRGAAQNGSPAAAAGASSAAAELSGLRILLVDDEADSRDLLNFVLESRGARVATAGSASEALGIIETENFDIIISDIGMPEEDGYSLIRRIRSLPSGRGGNVAAIALTAYARAEDRVQALRSGFQLHIAKPVESMELVAAVANLAGRMKKTSENEIP
ncbi:MAG: PAS domain S-box protein [Acidobacteriota bacterium]|nr:PAS domain S-box protein [Acidobacteriota bacterium]